MPDMLSDTCKTCGRHLTADEIGLTRKMINRGSTVFYCMTCLSKEFGVTEDALQRMIVRFKKQGCTLFAPLNDK